MKRVSPEDVERQIQQMEAILENVKASGVHSEEQYYTLRVMVDVIHDVKRELVKKHPSMRRIRELTSRIRLSPTADETDGGDEGSAR
jgi:hypothetical protein